MSGMEYPKRDAFHAHRVVRALSRTCAAQVIGTDACWLVAVIAHQEDTKRYNGPVTYWNEQLMPICGFGGRSRLVTARAKAVKGGWLHYEHGVKHMAGRYWTLIPETMQDLPDTTIGEAFDHLPSQIGTPTAVPEQDGNALPSQNRTESGRKVGRNLDGKWDGNRAPFLPSPIPSPNPVICSEPQAASEPPVMVFQCHGEIKTWDLTKAMVERFQAAYPALDIMAECRKADLWLFTNPARRKTARGMGKFLSGWLAKAQNNGGGRVNGHAKPADPSDTWAGIEDLKGITFSAMTPEQKARFLEHEKKRNAKFMPAEPKT